jgi:hypothetical protein
VLLRLSRPVKVHPITGAPLEPLGWRKNGAPIWPILGGSEPPNQPGDEPPAAPPADTGFPTNTPWRDMTAEQQVAYWQQQARKHEDRVKSYGGLTPEQLADLQERAEQFDVLAAASQTDTERAVSEAAFNARLVAEAELMPRLVAAEFRAATAGRLEADRLATILEPLDLSKFLTDDGEVDTDKVTAFVDGIAPVRGTEPQRLGPSPQGAGRRGSYTTAASSVASGRELYESMHSRKP